MNGKNNWRLSPIYDKILLEKVFLYIAKTKIKKLAI